jgi:iron complex outermembrane receptor protein
MLKRLQFIVFLLFCLHAAYGQFQITGSVTNAETEESLPGATILLEKGFLATTTNAHGVFSINGVKKGSYVLKISYIGYETEVLEKVVNEDTEIDVKLIPKAYLSEEVIISAIRAGGGTPTTYNVLTSGEIEQRNSGRDLPYVMETLPSTVVTSDAGNGVGYTGIRIRGTDLTGINVTLNGVPVNDAESHAVFFVDLPDLASSIDDMKVQRGVGASTNGAATFGASINIKTSDFRDKAYAEINSAAGSFNTFKNTLKFGSGLIKDKWTFDGRLSLIKSDGYIDRASSDLRSFYVAGGYYGKKDVVKAIVLYGDEKTYQAWYGVPKDSLETNRRFNPAGTILDNEGNFLGFYENQTDNYIQTYYQLHWGHEFNKRLSLATALFYTRGIGYYENYRNNRTFAEYGWNDTVIGNDTISKTNLIDQKWLDNHYYGLNFSISYNPHRWRFNFGTGANQYDGDHYGYVIWSQVARLGDYNRPWYQNNGLKTDFHVFAKSMFSVNENLHLYLDLQYRHIDYKIDGTHDDLRDLTQYQVYNFFNPKIGLDFRLNQSNSLNLYAGIANREPNRSVFRDADPDQEIKPERLFDFEAGYTFQARNIIIELNGFYMNYRDQLVLTGQINNVGAPIMTNVPRSYRAGIEFMGAVHFLKIVDWKLNATYSQNKILNFTSYVDDWTNWPDQVVSDLGTTDISFSPDVIMASELSVEPLENFRIALVSKYVGRQYIDNTSSIDRSIDPFFVNNLEVFYSLKLNAIRQIDFWIHLNNIFNEEYETYAWVYRYYYAGQEYALNGYFPQAGFNFMAGINLKF